MNDLFVRTTTGILIVGLITLAVLLGKYYFGALTFIISTLSLYEFARLALRRRKKPFLLILPVSGALIFFISVLILWDFLKPTYFSFAILLILLIFLIDWLIQRRLLMALTPVFAIIYILAPLLMLNGFFEFGHQKGRLLLMGFFILIWSNDTFAYLVGKKLGRTQLSPVSPKKTWEGFAGGMFFTLIVSILLFYLMGQTGVWQWLSLAIIVIIFGTTGDLIESSLKRSFDAKDAGNILPGHGGFLDRFDSVYLAAPFAFVFCYYFIK